MAVMAIWAVVLISYGFSTGIALDSETGSDDVLPLDMAPNSVDDMYDGCKENIKVQTEYLQDEKNKDMIFKNAWDEAEQHNRKLYGSNELKKEEIIAIYVYTLSGDELYADFNNAVRSQKSEYKTTFGYHALHFYLTSALQKLDEEQKAKGRECLTSYRGVDKKFSQDVSGKEFRFGSFTSSSAGYKIAIAFGRKSCFKIETCYGADISLYSKFPDEKEVLIPPYEVFKVIKIEKRSEEKSLPCEVVYEVQSTRKTLSNMNCALYTHIYMYIYISVGICLFVCVCLACYCIFFNKSSTCHLRSINFELFQITHTDSDMLIQNEMV
ncbi:erythroblast NAD(P)(+)--arginine ADP-ribosyltransferase-like isoform X2 [Larimichthys crocea]|uniref:erythroblast NAD(P)(+)--arginine ADP-ribosyltransferase-like isoform X2 n=1 Tax=Larimichthys crocea TaxID=215358 RepID=UPI000F5F7E21|nr:erythroblast NAD(P)(+)--arginine ADP-ribosyltransferase-like isoform X2 [Larimichthys crocea]XP_019113466.2 erythroblast NAD(P)(+)--arginine ADP-ribosyltransferase-like isoform X2 [Larimichthys crocea]XP_027139539.1 erythroblast NAD(P)(+)--arginine ADP-ribosyltransferase-like isoform X2 [Larimichthys crocea]